MIEAAQDVPYALGDKSAGRCRGVPRGYLRAGVRAALRRLFCRRGCGNRYVRLARIDQAQLGCVLAELHACNGAVRRVDAGQQGVLDGAGLYYPVFRAGRNKGACRVDAIGALLECKICRIQCAALQADAGLQKGFNRRAGRLDFTPGEPAIPIAVDLQCNVKVAQGNIRAQCRHRPITVKKQIGVAGLVRVRWHKQTGQEYDHQPAQREARCLSEWC